MSEIANPDAALDAIHVGRPLYKRDSKGGLRVWYMEREGHKHRTVAGLDGGALTTSGWTTCTGKQKRNDVEQAIFEINAAYTHGLKREYFETPAEADGEKRFFKPQLAEKWSDTTWAKWLARVTKAKVVLAEGRTGAYFQPKLDGFCCIAQKSGLTSREGQPIIAVPHIMEALQPFFEADPEAVFHGELYQHELKDDFEQLSSILKKQKNITPEQFALAHDMAQFHIYDYASPSVRELPFGQRHEKLMLDLAEAWGRGPLHSVATTPLRDEAHMLELFYAAVEDGYEGGIGRLDLPYEQKRTWAVIKIKIFDDAEFEVVEIVEGNGNYAGYAKRVTCITADGKLFGAGIKGGQKPRYLIEAFRAEGHKVVTIEFFGWTKAGVPRMGRATKWHGEERTL